jgi:hypothetical protein
MFEWNGEERCFLSVSASSSLAIKVVPNCQWITSKVLSAKRKVSAFRLCTYKWVVRSYEYEYRHVLLLPVVEPAAANFSTGGTQMRLIVAFANHTFTATITE